MSAFCERLKLLTRGQATTLRRQEGTEDTHKQRECFLELGDLLLSKRVSLRQRVSRLPVCAVPVGLAIVMFFPRRGMEWRLRGADAPWLLGGGDGRRVAVVRTREIGREREFRRGVRKV